MQGREPTTHSTMNNTVLFQAVTTIDYCGEQVSMVEGPAFFTRQEAEEWLKASDLDDSYTVQGVKAFQM
jgi:hypothetical protein